MKSLRLLPILLALAACSQNPATGTPMFTLANKAELTEAGEANATGTLKAEGLYRPDSPASIFVNDLCNRMYAVTEAANEAVQCNLADDNTVNAFATPGYVFINRGLLAYLNSEAELAAVLGHEAGHLTARHTAQSITNQRITSAIAMVTLAATTPDVADDDYSGLAHTTGKAETFGTAVMLTNKVFSRGQETEADKLGRRYLKNAGYDPRESVNAQRAMLLYNDYADKQQAAFGILDKSFIARLKATHPPSTERLAAALAETGEPPVLPPAEDLGRQRYMAAINGLAYGPARRYGIAREHELVLTRQRLVLPLPQGVTTDYFSSNHPRNLGTWLIGHVPSGVTVSLTSLPLTTGRNPGVVVRGMMSFLHTPLSRINIGDPTVSATTPTTSADDAALADDPILTDELDDTPIAPKQVIGYTSTYHYLNSPRWFRAIAFTAPTRRNEMIVMEISYPNEQTMQQEDANIVNILKNVRFLTRTQALQYKQLELRTFTAAAGDSVTREATKLPVTALNEDLFRTLNNLPHGTDLTIGQTYKTIFDPNP